MWIETFFVIQALSYRKYIVFIWTVNFSNLNIGLEQGCGFANIKELLFWWQVYNLGVNLPHESLNKMSPGYHFTKALRGKIAPKLVSFVLEKKLLNFNETTPRIICCTWRVSLLRYRLGARLQWKFLGLPAWVAWTLRRVGIWTHVLRIPASIAACVLPGMLMMWTVYVLWATVEKNAKQVRNVLFEMRFKLTNTHNLHTIENVIAIDSVYQYHKIRILWCIVY